MLNPWIMWSAVSGTARYGMLYCQCGQFVLNNFRLSTVLQILIFLPLTLATLSKQAFLLLSLLLCIHAFIHGTLALLWGSEALSVLQVPIHPFLLLVCFNVFSSSVNPYLALAVNCWGMALSFFGPLFIVMEGLSSLLVVQKLGQEGKKLVYKGESYQFVFLVAAAVAYVASAWWIVVVSLVAWLKDCSFRNESSHIQMPPLSSTLLGVALTAFVFLTLIGFVSRRTNIIESSGLAVVLAYNVWLCGFDQKSFADPIAS